MVEVEIIHEFYEKYKKRITWSIYNWRIKESKLVEDTLQEIYAVFLKRGKGIKYRAAIHQQVENWTIEGINNILRNYFPETRLLKRRDILNFQEKVDRLINEWNYSADDAERLVISEATLEKNRSFIKKMNLKSKVHEKGNASSNSSEWIDWVRNEFPKIENLDNLFIIDAIKFCFEKLEKIKGVRKNKIKRNINIMKHIFIFDTNQNKIAQMYQLNESRIVQIKGKYLPHLQSCLKNQLGLKDN